MSEQRRGAKRENLQAKMEHFRATCRAKGLKVTPQRTAVYEALLRTDRHPSAEVVYRQVRRRHPSISLDTVNRTLLTLSEIGLAFAVEGSGDARRFDANLAVHQHFKCVKCRRIIDFHHAPFDEIKVPQNLAARCTVLRKTVYFEGICETCSKAAS
jgi:Fur family peroxide stress response transcriptional regulator